MADEVWKPCLLGVSPSGHERPRGQHPRLPIGADDLAAAVADSVAAGACFARIHVRDDAGLPTLAARAVQHASEAIRRRIGRGVVIQPAAIAGRFATPLDIANLAREIKPESVALRLSEIVPDESALSEAARFLAWLAREHVAPHYLLADVGEVERYLSLRGRGVLPDAPHLVEFAPNAADGKALRAQALLPMVAAYGGDMPWTCQGSGRFEAAVTAAGMALDGHATVGFEFNLLLANGDTAPDNAALIAQSARTLASIGRPVATVDDMRVLLGR